jgi:hypothetical protein
MARNASGIYSLPFAQVIGGNPIQATWANGTLADLATEVTDSLNRSGKGGMLSPLALADGVVGAPGLTFTADPDSGLYLTAAGDPRFSVDGAEVLRLKSLTVPKTSTSDFTTSSLTFVDLTGIAFPVLSNEFYTWEIIGVLTANDANAVNVTFTGPAAPTRVDFMFTNAGASATGFGTAIPITPTAAGTVVRLQGMLRNGANAGTVQMQIRKQVAGSLTWFRGWRLAWQHLNTLL